jgi:hypothetical protein
MFEFCSVSPTQKARWIPCQHFICSILRSVGLSSAYILHIESILNVLWLDDSNLIAKLYGCLLGSLPASVRARDCEDTDTAACSHTELLLSAALLYCIVSTGVWMFMLNIKRDRCAGSKLRRYSTGEAQCWKFSRVATLSVGAPCRLQLMFTCLSGRLNGTIYMQQRWWATC